MYQMNKKQTLQQGMIKRHPDGFGFFIPDDPAATDVYIPRHSMNGVMTNDRVVVNVEPERGTGRFRGEIVRIVERGTKKVVGRFQALKNGGGLLRDEGKGWGHDLRLRAGETMEAKEGELVAAEILSFPEDGKEFRGKVVQVIGNSQDPLTDIQRVVHGLNIPDEFSKAAKHEASRLTAHVSEADMKGRKNLRALNFVTIDGATAKDFDDAVYVEQNPRGFRLYVAIADVSHYVRPGSAIDKDAYERGTSVYFPNFVIPMLPEILSNELCSLNPHVPRLALVADMQLDFTGEFIESHFYEAVIESHARVTYGEAQEIIDGNEIDKLKHVTADIRRAADLAKILMTRRFREGSLDLEIPETQLLIDGAGNPIDIIRSERLFSHRLIEEMMLAANVAVAKFLSDQNIPALYRIHEPPNPDAIALLEKYLRNFGGRVKLDEGKLQKRLTKALQEFEGKPEAQVLNILTLRSMSQAKYSSNNVGHFGLGFEFYTHFTSPIRRYPDLIVHRLIKNRVMPKSAYRLLGEDELASAGVMLSACEQRAVKAERQIQAIKKARFMQKHEGEEFDGIISSVTKFGVFVLLRQFEVDGLIHIDNLGTQRFEKFEFDEENLRLIAKRSGFSYNIGDSIRVRVVSADPEEGKIDFELAERAAPQKVERFKKTSAAEKYARENTRALGDADVLDLDAMPVEDHSVSKSEPFDPGKKLEEALRRRGLRPSSDAGERPQRIGFRSKFERGSSREEFGSRRRSDDERSSSSDRRSGEDRRQGAGRRESDHAESMPFRKKKSGGKMHGGHKKSGGKKRSSGKGRSSRKRR
jgi:ribonuclease R